MKTSKIFVPMIALIFFSFGLGLGLWLRSEEPATSVTEQKNEDRREANLTVSRKIPTPAGRTPEPALEKPAPRYVANSEDNGAGRRIAVSEAALPKAILDARNLMRLGKSEKALATLQDALAQQPDNADLLTEIADFNSQVLGKDRQSVEYLEKALQRDPNHQQALQQLLYMSMYPKEKGTSKEVNALLTKLVEKHGDSPNVLSTYGLMLARQNRIGDAVSLLEKANSLPDANEETKYRLADVHYQANQPQKATAVFISMRQQAEKKFQESPSELNRRELFNRDLDVAYALAKEGRTTDALRSLESQLSQYPDDLQLRRAYEDFRRQTDKG